MASKRTGRGTVLFGLVVLLAGIAGAVVLYLLSQQRGDDAIRDLARAPVGCDTTLSFSDTGTFYVFVEHLGQTRRRSTVTARRHRRVLPRPRGRARGDDHAGGRRRDRGRARPTRRRVHVLPRRLVRRNRDAPVRDRDHRRLRHDGRVGRRRRLRRRRRTRSRRRWRPRCALGALGVGDRGHRSRDSASCWWASAGRGDARRVVDGVHRRPPGWPVGAPLPTAPPLMRPPHHPAGCRRRDSRVSGHRCRPSGHRRCHRRSRRPVRTRHPIGRSHRPVRATTRLRATRCCRPARRHRHPETRSRRRDPATPRDPRVHHSTRQPAAATDGDARRRQRRRMTVTTRP